MDSPVDRFEPLWFRHFVRGLNDTALVDLLHEFGFLLHERGFIGWRAMSDLADEVEIVHFTKIRRATALLRIKDLPRVLTARLRKPLPSTVTAKNGAEMWKGGRP